MQIKQIKKRTGDIVPFNPEKITNAIKKANTASLDTILSSQELSLLTNEVVASLDDTHIPTVEEIQDIVEKILIKNNRADTAKAYILYRQKHTERRNASQKLMEQYKDLLFADAKGMDSKRDNANINTDSPMGIMLKLGTEGAKCYADHFAIPDEYAKADRENYVHIHDKDFSMITANCCQIDILKLFKGGFSTGHGYLREPNSIRSAASLACIAIQSNQNDMFKPLG